VAQPKPYGWTISVATAQVSAVGLSRRSASISLKAPGIFAVSAPTGDIDSRVAPSHGVHFHDTRFLSQAMLRIAGVQPILEEVRVHRYDRCTFELTNPGLQLADQILLPEGSLRILRRRALSHQVRERLEVKNDATARVEVDMVLTFAAGFEHITDIRRSAEPTRVTESAWVDHLLVFRYRGADGRLRSTTLTFDPVPDLETVGAATYHLRLDAGECRNVQIRIFLTDLGEGDLEVIPPAQGAVPSVRGLQVETSNPRFDAVLARALDDLQMLVTRQEGQSFFAAGIPWFVALFGRDSLITGLQMLAYQPRIAAENLRLLARYQGCRHDVQRDEEPGKIVHEVRTGENANRSHVPQDRYYGTADATPLFLMLLAEYVRWTGDLGLWRELRPNVERALGWLEAADHDGDGFVDYERQTADGLENQGWKDSWNSIRHRDGTLAEPPIALVELQAYVYRAKLAAAGLLRIDGETALADRLQAEARRLRRRFHRAFWVPDRQFFAVALQRGRRPVESVTSNPGHALWCGLLNPGAATAVARMLLSRRMFSGWGIRTLAADEVAYDPEDYQVGAVWPHDNSLIVQGLKRYGFDSYALRVFTGLFDAARTFPDQRLPELFAGFSRDGSPQPVGYPDACTPQAWAAGAVPFMLQSILGLEPDALRGVLRIVRPRLPYWLRQVTLRGLRVGEGSVDLRFMQVDRVVRVGILRLEGGIKVQRCG
jgi:glycogen debranching enzyme